MLSGLPAVSFTTTPKGLRLQPPYNPGLIGEAIIRPFGKVSYEIRASVNTQGQIVRPDFFGYQQLGQVDGQGNYKLISGQQGNIFNDPYLRIKGYDNDTNPFALVLKQAERQKAALNSEIPLIRMYLTSQGLTGQGIKVGILDGLYANTGVNKAPTISDHSKLVAQTIQDPVWGVAPGAQVLQLGEPWNIDTDLASDSLKAFANKVTSDYVNLYSYMSNKLQNLLVQPDPVLRILNITAGISRVLLYNRLITILLREDENGYYQYPMLRNELFGAAKNGTEEQQFQVMVNFVDQLLDTSPLVQQAYLRYVDMTRQAANRGIIIVTASGNENGGTPIPAMLQPSSAYNELAKSPYVLTVAASNTNQMSGHQSAYSVAFFSSRGDGHLWNPTIAAPGVLLGYSLPIGKLAHNLTANGTSFATPFTCGVIAMMLQKNPYLTFEQIKAKLQNSAVKSPAYGPADYGAGFLNPEAAIYSV